MTIRKIFALVILLHFTGVFYAQEASGQHGLYASGQVSEIAISFPESNWQYLLDSFRLNGNRMLLATVSINGADYPDAGVRFSGSRSFRPGQARNSLYIQLNMIDRARNHQGQTRLKLSNALRDPSMVREVLSFEIARQYMPAPGANYARVSINGVFYGLMVNIEPVSGNFLTQYFGEAEGAFFSANPALNSNAPAGCKQNIYCNLELDNSARCYLNNYQMLSDYGWNELIELTRVLEEDPENVDDILNVDRTLWMLAFNNLLVNLNSYSGNVSENFYLYRDTTGRFNPVLWDMNLSFGSYKNTGKGSDLDLKGLVELDPLLHAENPTKPLISKLLSDPLNRKIYLAHMRSILQDWFLNDRYLEKAKTLQNGIDSLYSEDPNRFYSMEEFRRSLDSTIGKRSRIPGLEELMSRRVRFLRKHQDMSVIPPDVVEYLVKKREPFSAEVIEDFRIQVAVGKFPKRVHIFYRYGPDQEYRQALMFDDGMHEDMEKGDGVFAITLPPMEGNDALEFYFMAENAGAVTFDPPNYMFNGYQVTLEELNQ